MCYPFLQHSTCFYIGLFGITSHNTSVNLAALVMVLGTGSSVVFAQEVNNSSAIVAEAQVPQDEFVKIDPTELPQAVMQTLAKDYEGASVKEAYVKETEETTLYKIIIVTQDGQEAETLLNEKGEIVKE